MTEEQSEPRPRPQFHSFAAEVYARKLAPGKIRSSAGKMKWKTVLVRHLVPAFGELFIDRIEAADVEAWRVKVTTKIDAGEIAPATANTVLGVLHQITDEAVDEFDIRDPMRGIEPFETNEQVGDCPRQPQEVVVSANGSSG
jgi:hypothetical protein